MLRKGHNFPEVMAVRTSSFPWKPPAANARAVRTHRPEKGPVAMKFLCGVFTFNRFIDRERF